MNRNQILSESIVIFDKHLQLNLKNAMTLALKKLFSLAENASSNQEEQELFNQYRQLKSGAKTLSDVLRRKIKSMPEFISAEVNKSDNKMSLSLVEDEELSITLSLTQLDSTLEVAGHAELYTLEKRMNVIFGNEHIDKTNMPFSPASIVWLFSHAFKSIVFAVQVKTLIIDFLGKEFLSDINETYSEINEVFIQGGILPNLQPEVAPHNNQASNKDADSKAAEADPNQIDGTQDEAEVESFTQSAEQGTQQEILGSQATSADVPNDVAPSRQFDPLTKQLVDSIFDLMSPTNAVAQPMAPTQFNAPNTGGLSSNPNSTFSGSSAANTQSANNPAGIYPTGASGQVGDRTSRASDHDSPAQHQAVADNDFDQALAQIAQESGVVATSRNIHHLKEMLADQVKNNTGNYYPTLSEKQNNTLDLMGMMYDEIEQDRSIDSHIRSSFNAINVPLLRMAVNDENFFTDSAHPARKFMELLVESSQKWHGTHVIKKVHQYSDSAAKGFDGSTQSFVDALKDLTQYLEVTETRAQKAEQKCVSAAQGKEKMELTKAQVEAHLVDILEGCEIKFIRDIIFHVWRDSLTLTLLREGKDSDQWEKKTKSAKVIAQIGNKNRFMKLSGADKLAAMHHLDETMDELGFSKRDRISTKDNIHTCLGWQEKDSEGLNNENDSPELKRVLSIDEAVKSQEINSANKKIEEIRELTDEEKLIMETIINMPYGSLFDFVINQQSDTLRRKLSWVSTMSETALFVDLVGRNPHKMKLPRVAIDVLRKNIIRVKVEEGGYFKNALNKIMNRLKKMAA